MKPSTNQDAPEENMNHESNGQFAPGNNANPDGKGGFGDNPENRSDGRWNKEGSISNQYNRILRMTDEEYEAFQPNTRAERIALARIKEAEKANGLQDAKEITDRTEGKAPQKVDITTNDESLNLFGKLDTETLKKLANA